MNESSNINIKERNYLLDIHLYGINISDMPLYWIKRPFNTNKNLPPGNRAPIPPSATRVTATIGRHETHESLTSTKWQKNNETKPNNIQRCHAVSFLKRLACVFFFFFCPAFPVARERIKRNHDLIHVESLSCLCWGFRLGLRPHLSSQSAFQMKLCHNT